MFDCWESEVILSRVFGGIVVEDEVAPQYLVLGSNTAKCAVYPGR